MRGMLQYILKSKIGIHTLNVKRFFFSTKKIENNRHYNLIGVKLIHSSGKQETSSVKVIFFVICKYWMVATSK